MGTIIDITGCKFGKLTVIKLSSKKSGRTLMWDCICECGGNKTVISSSLKRGNTLSCGCIKKEVLASRNTKHGLSHTRIYDIWLGMVKRCTKRNSSAYKYYGGKGIIVCDRWLNFINFYNDTIQGYSDELSLDRYPDTKGNYEPNNFRWATEEQQANNKTDNHLLTYNGKTLTIAQWSKEIGVKYRFLQNRIAKGWEVEKALTLPAQKVTNNRRDFKGKHLYEVG